MTGQVSRYRCDRGTEKERARKIISAFRNADAVDDESADDHRENVGKAVHHLQESDVQVRESELLA